MDVTDNLPLFERHPHPTHRMHSNSLHAISKERTTLNSRSLDILKDVRINGPGTDREIAERMGFKHKSAVQPRISDLIEDGLLFQVGESTCRETGRPNRIVGLERPAV